MVRTRRNLSDEREILFEPEIERILHTQRRNRNLQQNQQATITPIRMTDNEKPNRDFAQPELTAILPAIARQTTEANNFNLHPSLVHMCRDLSFGGGAMDDPDSHLASFVEIFDTFKANGVSEEVVRLKLFQFSLRDKAKNWLDAQPSGSITTWEDLAKKFLSKFFPPGKTAKLRSEINNFYQQDGESLSEAWERFKELIRRCPHHNIVKWMLVQNFFNGLDAASNTPINAASGGAFLKKNQEEAWELLEEMVSTNTQWHNERGAPKKGGKHDVSQIDLMAAKLEALTKNLDKLQPKANAVNAKEVICEYCAGDHRGVDCVNTGNKQPGEEINYVGNQNRYQNFNQRKYDHPGFSYGNKKGGLQPPPSNQAQ